MCVNESCVVSTFNNQTTTSRLHGQSNMSVCKLSHIYPCARTHTDIVTSIGRTKTTSQKYLAAETATREEEWKNHMLTWLIVWLVSKNIVSNELNIYLMVIFHTMLHGCGYMRRYKEQRNFHKLIYIDQNAITEWTNVCKRITRYELAFMHVRNYSFMQILVFFSISSARIVR